jgi:DHA1 family bicyclomycin/chloramphenicol resistance-like MFS transporter
MSGVNASRLAVVLGGLIAVGPLAIDTYLPALPLMADSFAVSVPDVEFTLSLYLLGTALGQLVCGPLSDHLGRRPVGTFGLLLYLVTSLLIAISDQLWQLYSLRFLQAIGGGATVVICAASVRDHFDGRRAARVITLIGLVMLCAPLIAPALGTVLNQTLGWRAIFYFLAVYAAIMLWVLRAGLPVMPAVRKSRASVAEVSRAYWRVLSHRRGLGYILSNGLAFAAMFAFITDSAFVYIEHFGISETAFPFYFGANVVAMIGLNRLNVRLLKRWDSPPILAAGLLIQVCAAVALAVLQALGLLTLWLAVPLIMCAVSIVALIIPNAIASFIHYFPADSGSATAINGALQFLLAGTAGSLLAMFHDHTLTPMVSLMLVCSLLALVARGWAQGGPDQMVESSKGD